MGGVRTMTHGSEAVFSLTSAPAAISICTICAFISQDDASSLLLHWRSKLNAETLNVACSATWLKHAVSSVALLALVAVVFLLVVEGIAFGQSKSGVRGQQFPHGRYVLFRRGGDKAIFSFPGNYSKQLFDFGLINHRSFVTNDASRWQRYFKVFSYIRLSLARVAPICEAATILVWDHVRAVEQNYWLRQQLRFEMPS